MQYNPPFTLTEEMLELVAEITETLGNIKSVQDLDKLPRLRRIGRIKSIHSSLAIENNSLTLDQVSDIIDGKRVLAPPNEILEVKNAIAAYKELEKSNPFELKNMFKVHSVMMAGLIEETGELRTVNEGVYSSTGALVHIAPPPDMLPQHITNLFSWLKASTVHALIKSSVFHYEFEFIHPFRDGNGRMGRLWQTAILMNWKPIFAWIPVERIIRERQADYYTAISKSTSIGNSNPFILYMLEVILNAVKAIAIEAEAHINHISTRIRKLLSVMDVYPMEATEIMQKLGLKSRDALRNSYLAPALEAGLILMTEPDKPTSRNQRYYKK